MAVRRGIVRGNLDELAAVDNTNLQDWKLHQLENADLPCIYVMPVVDENVRSPNVKESQRIVRVMKRYLRKESTESKWLQRARQLENATTLSRPSVLG